MTALMVGACPPGAGARAPVGAVVRGGDGVFRCVHGPVGRYDRDLGVPGVAARVRGAAGGGAMGVAGVSAGAGRAAGAGGALVGPGWPQAGLPVRVRGVHRRVGSVRLRHLVGDAGRSAAGPGAGCGDVAGQQRRPGRDQRAGAASARGAGGSGRCAGDRSGARPDGGWSVGGLGGLAVDLLDQCARRCPRGGGGLVPAAADPPACPAARGFDGGGLALLGVASTACCWRCRRRPVWH